MKKILVLILSLFFAKVSLALPPPLLDLSTHGEAVCDNCSGSLKFAWHMEDNDSTPDVTLGNPCGCSDGDSIGAETGSPDFSAVQKSDGTYSLHVNAIDEYYTFDVSADDLIEPDNIKITFDIYVVSYPVATYHRCIAADLDASNHLYIRIGSTGKVQATYIGNADAEYFGVDVATGSWVSCELQMKTGIEGNDSYLICGINSVESDLDITAMSGSMSTLSFGDNGGSNAGEYYLDNVKIYPCDRY